MNWAVQDAKARFSELLRAAEKGPQVITYRGAPTYEIRKIDPSLQGKKRLTLVEALKLCPKVPEFELPERKFEPPRKIFEDDED
jgi:antitoxin (DNA-binding transcriptional repressor) of toxin-antitoxin stability system